MANPRKVTQIGSGFSRRLPAQPAGGVRARTLAGPSRSLCSRRSRAQDMARPETPKHASRCAPRTPPQIHLTGCHVLSHTHTYTHRHAHAHTNPYYGMPTLADIMPSPSSPDAARARWLERQTNFPTCPLFPIGVGLSVHMMRRRNAQHVSGRPQAALPESRPPIQRSARFSQPHWLLPVAAVVGEHSKREADSREKVLF